MKLKLKLIAAAAVMAAASGSQAALITAATGNSSLALVAFNVVTNSYYVRDLGFTLNSFLPNAITTASGDGAVTGDKTPEAGFNTTFGGAGQFVSWLGTQNQADIRWTVAAGDAQVAATNNFSRALVAFAPGSTSTATNTSVRNAVASAAGASGLASQNPGLGFDGTGSTVLPSFLSNNSFGASTLSSLGAVASLFYYTTTSGGGNNATAANQNAFSNSLNTATLSLASNGVLTYDLQAAAAPSAVPVPAAAWLLGSGLLGIGGMIRRRKAPAAAA